MKRILFLFILIWAKIGMAQSINISESDFNKFENPNRVLYYDSRNNKYFGCGLNLDCLPLQTLFSRIVIDKRTKKIIVEGYINPQLSGKDTIGFKMYNIFLAKPSKGKLKHIFNILNVDGSVKYRSADAEMDLKSGKFIINFTIPKKSCLYINCEGLYELKEYKVNELVSTLSQ